MKLYASELMELARKEPEKYEGKRYRAIGGNLIVDLGGKDYKSLYVKDGKLLAETKYYEPARISSNLELEEIKPEPQLVPFMEAAEANENNKTVECKIHGYVNVYKPTLASGMIDQNGRAVSACEIVHGEWYIVGKEG